MYTLAPTVPTTVDDFTTICANIGKIDMCCTLDLVSLLIEIPRNIEAAANRRTAVPRSALLQADLNTR